MCWYLVKKYLQKAGLDVNKYSVHKLRHTAATLMYKHGNVDIRALQEADSCMVIQEAALVESVEELKVSAQKHFEKLDEVLKG